MSSCDDKTTPSPSPCEALLARLLAELEKTPLPDQRAVVERYISEHPECAAHIREVVKTDAVLRKPERNEALSLQPGQRLGPFRVVRFVAAGGMGEVYEAEQDRLDRKVALKVLRQGMVHPIMRARFLREQKVLAKLHQTNIVPVHYSGQEGDLQYCAMHFVDGASLRAVVTELHRLVTSAPGGRQTPPIQKVVDSLLGPKPHPQAEIATTANGGIGPTGPMQLPPLSVPSMTLSPAYFCSAARVMIQVAEAVQHGHDHRICHRDLKPSNLIIDPSETCWVIDYGIASAVNESATSCAAVGEALEEKLTHSPLGTPNYMSPEQFKGTTDERSDVWALGVILYELLTLQQAFPGKVWADVERRVTETEPVDVRKLVRNVPADLAAITRKTMAKAPASRYPSARAFADDLRRWLNWEPTTVRPGWRTLRPLRLWAWRRKAWAVTAAVVVAASITGVIADSEISQARLAVANNRAEERQRQLVELQQHQQQLDREGDVRMSQKITDGVRFAGWSHEAMRHLEIANSIRSGEDLRNHVAAALAGLDATQIYEYPAQSDPEAKTLGVSRVVFSPDGKRVLGGGESTRKASGTVHSPALLWDGNLANKPDQSTRPGAGPVAFPDADSPLQLLLPAKPGQPLTLWNVATNTRVTDISLPWPGEVVAAALSADARLAAVSFHPVPSLWGLPGPLNILWAIDRKPVSTTIRKLGAWPGSSSVLAFSGDGRLVATGSEAGHVTIRSTVDVKPVCEFSESELPITALAFGRNYHRPSDERPPQADLLARNVLAVGSKGGDLSVWELRPPTPRQMNRFYGSEHDVYGVAFSPDGTTLASAGRNFPFLWDVGTGRVLLSVSRPGVGFRPWTEGVAFSPDGQRVAFGSSTNFGDAGLNVFRLDEDRGIKTYRGLKGAIAKTWLSPSGKWIAGLSQSWQLGVWDRATGQVAFVWNVPPGITADNSALAFDENDTQILFASGERVSRWNLTSGDVTGTWKLPLGLNDTLVTRPGKKPIVVRRDPWPPGPQMAIRARELGPDGMFTDLYRLADIDPRSVLDTTMAADGGVLLVNLWATPRVRRAFLFDGLTGKPIPPDLALLPANYGYGHMTATGKTLILDEPIDDRSRSLVFRLPDLKRLGTHPILHRSGLSRTDDASKLALAAVVRPPYGGIALYRVGEGNPIVTFEFDQPPAGDGYGISPDGQFMYWGRRDGTVWGIDLNKYLERLAPFRK